jgi:phosphoglycerol transferase MdoB-like AlkP superfamily enzyme
MFKTGILKHFIFLLLIYITGIVFFSLFRALLLLTELNLLTVLPHKFYLISNAFLIGFRFDSVISGYILALPLLAMAGASVFKWENRKFYIAVTTFISFFYLLSFIICAADIPYFNYYFSRITIAILNWSDSPAFMFKMVFKEYRYFIYVILFFALAGVFVYLVHKLRIKFLDEVKFNRQTPNLRFVTFNIIVSLFSFIITFVAIRGRVEEKSPIRVGTAFFSNYSFPNQLGLNPVFTFMRSCLDASRPENKRLNLMDDKTAINNVRDYLNINANYNYNSPIARRVTADGKQISPNVVVVIMESMSAEKMTRFGNKGNLTRNLDSLAKVSYCFDNIYTAGIHTRNGIYSTLFSFPALLRQHPMDKVIVPQFSGFSNTLAANGYQTIFFVTHDDQFDNIGGFLNSNSFQKIVSQKDYPPDRILSTLGVADDYLFEYATPKLTELSSTGKPFFAAFMTVSDHGPYIIPKNIPFKAHSQSIQQQMIEYADWSIGKFIHLASKQKWFDNTIFVFVADHGAVVGNNLYDIALSFHHTPLIMYAPKILKPTVFKQIGGQIDIFPTVMGLLNINYVNNTMGIDLLKQKRPYIFFSDDDKIGCLNEDYFYIDRINGNESLYKYKLYDTKNYYGELKQKADSMKRYAFSMMQASEWIIEKNKAGRIK